MNLKVILVCVLFFQAMVVTSADISASTDEKTSENNQHTRDKIEKLEAIQRQLLELLTTKPYPISEHGPTPQQLDEIIIDTNRRVKALSKNEEYQAYMKEIYSRLEDCMNENYSIIQEKELYGSGMLRFTLDKDGGLVSNTIIRKSGVSELDSHILKVVAASAPFPAVPKSYYEISEEKIFFERVEFEYFRDSSIDKSNVQFHCKFK
ncbi:energy transducer TonB [Undibacterium sp. Ji50W]|uniref:energy transducer TonB n=1 Tax=Undibacterium sp. Ji50W TaxID=3413041 RepID=UPI003BF1835C